MIKTPVGQFDHLGVISACLFQPIICVESPVQFLGIAISTF